MDKSRRFMVRASLLAACAAVLWVGGLLAGARASDLGALAASARGEVQQVAMLARKLAAARAQGGVRVQRMARSEANSWAYWEAVARLSRVPTDAYGIDPSFAEPAEGAGGPTLLTTSVRLSGVTLRQLLAFLFYMTEQRPYVGIASVDATKTPRGAWEATIESFVYFEEPPG